MDNDTADREARLTTERYGRAAMQLEKAKAALWPAYEELKAAKQEGVLSAQGVVGAILGCLAFLTVCYFGTRDIGIAEMITSMREDFDGIVLTAVSTVMTGFVVLATILPLSFSMFVGLISAQALFPPRARLEEQARLRKGMEVGLRERVAEVEAQHQDGFLWKFAAIAATKGAFEAHELKRILDTLVSWQDATQLDDPAQYCEIVDSLHRVAASEHQTGQREELVRRSTDCTAW